MTDDLNPKRTKKTGIKRDFLKVPAIVDEFENWICLQMQVPDDDEYIRQFYDLFDMFLGQWFTYQRTGNREGARVARVWRLARETISLGNCTGGVTVPACNPTPIGSIVMWGATATPPAGWLACYGQSVLVAEYPELFAVIGYQHGGSGSLFAVPDFKSRSPYGYNPSTGDGIVGQPYGSATHTLTASELPPHQHRITTRENSAGGSNARLMNAGAAGDNSNVNTDDGSENGLSSTPFSVLHPVRGIIFIIRASDNDCEDPVIEGPPGPPGPQGPPGTPGDCPDCPSDPPPGLDDNDVPEPPGTPGDAQRCKVAQGVVDSLLDNYYLPLTEFWIEQFTDLENTPQEVADALVKTLQDIPTAILFPPGIITIIGFMGSTMFGAYITAIYAAAVASNLQTIVDELNDTVVREQLYCDLYNVLPDNGNIDAAVWSNFIVAVDSHGLTPFIEFAYWMTNNCPLYIARTEAFITQGGSFDCTACGELCDAVANVWQDIGATPATWEALPAGVLDFSTWTGETIHASPPGTSITLETTTRAENENWTATGAVSPTGTPLRYMGIKYTPAEPCRVNRIQWQSLSNSGGGTKTMFVAAKLIDDSMVVLRSNLYTPAPITDQPTQLWIGTATEVKELWFVTGHYRGTGSVIIQVRNNYINVE